MRHGTSSKAVGLLCRPRASRVACVSTKGNLRAARISRLLQTAAFVEPTADPGVATRQPTGPAELAIVPCAGDFGPYHGRFEK